MTVASTVSVHLTEELLEEYCFGRVPEPALAVLEIHLLQCAACQIQLAELDEYVALMKQGAADYDLQAAQPTLASSWFAFPKLPSFSVVAAGAMMLLCVSTTIVWRSQTANLTPVTVGLTTLRGAPDVGISQVPAGHPVHLTINAASLPPSPQYRLHLVNGMGGEVWAGAIRQQGLSFHAYLEDGLRPGRYWVRLYSLNLSTAEPQREFSLLVR